ncbi:hypothetical protein HK104_006603, partial [Borealophlyctis nickersoniae]
LMKSAFAYKSRRKPLYLLNLIQCSLSLLKTVFATLYAVLLNLPCVARSPLINVPMVLCWDAIYAIMLLKLLLFARYKVLCKVVFAVGCTAHFVVVMVAISMRQWKMSVVGLCADKYPILYKQQYVVEMVMEGFTAAALLHGLIIQSRASSGLFSGTQDILRQLAQNEHIRVFFVLIFITAKVVLSYSPDFKIVAITHAVDSARSALICWALIREQRKVAETAAAGKRQSLAPPSAGGTAKKGSVQGGPKVVVTKYAAAGDGDGSARQLGPIARVASLSRGYAKPADAGNTQSTLEDGNMV